MTINADLQSFPGETTYLVLDDEIGMEQSYKQLINNPKTKEIWENGMCKELSRLIQGYNKTQGRNTCKIMTVDEIQPIPRDQTIMYARIVVDYRTQKTDPYRVRITVRGNLIKFPGITTTTTVDMISSKLFWNSVLSTPRACYTCFDVKDFYLQTPIDGFKYMRIPIGLIPDAFIKYYSLEKIYTRTTYILKSSVDYMAYRR